MYLVSWDKYKSVVRDITSEKIIAEVLTPETMFGKRTEIDRATKAAKKILEGVAIKFNVDYGHLIKSLMEKL